MMNGLPRTEETTVNAVFLYFHQALETRPLHRRRPPFTRMQRFGLLLCPDAPGLARSERLQCRYTLPRRGFQPLAQGFRVVRHEFRPVPGAADST